MLTWLLVDMFIFKLKYVPPCYGATHGSWKWIPLGAVGVWKKTKYNYWTITHMLGYGAGRTSVNYTHLVHWNCSPKW